MERQFELVLSFPDRPTPVRGVRVPVHPPPVINLTTSSRPLRTQSAPRRGTPLGSSPPRCERPPPCSPARKLQPQAASPRAPPQQRAPVHRSPAARRRHAGPPRPLSAARQTRPKARPSLPPPRAALHAASSRSRTLRSSRTAMPRNFYSTSPFLPRSKPAKNPRSPLTTRSLLSSRDV